MKTRLSVYFQNVVRIRKDGFIYICMHQFSVSYKELTVYIGYENLLILIK